jgi:glyoxalase family protein
MPSPTPGIHHVTAVGSDPNPSHQFYTETLGLRLVKRSVNQDDVSVYHLFYADNEGSTGTSMTVFPYPSARSGETGVGQVATTQFLIPGDAVEYWRERLETAGALYEDPLERFGDTVLRCRDPDGLALELVARDDAPAGNPPEGPVPAENAIRGFFGTTLSLASAESTGPLLEAMGYDPVAADSNRTRYRSDGDLGYVVDIVETPEGGRGQPGAGTIHHVAFRVEESEQAAWRDLLIDHGLRPTQIIDRKWFKSVYVRTEGGVLFEFASEGPGYTVDEPLDELGERLVLPDRLENRRGEIERDLPELD